MDGVGEKKSMILWLLFGSLVNSGCRHSEQAIIRVVGFREGRNNLVGTLVLRSMPACYLG